MAAEEGINISINVRVFIYFCVALSLLTGSKSVLSENSSDRLSEQKVSVVLSNEKKVQLQLEKEKKIHQQLIDSLIHRTKDIPMLLRSGKIKASEVPDPHWKKDACLACHTEGQAKASEKNLRTTDYEGSCLSCHADEFDHNYIHPVNIKPSSKKKQSMNAKMRKQIKSTNGKVTCSTCHDISLQCRLEDKHRHENAKFFREGPYSNRYDLCANCHKPEDYKRFNPHEHINEYGEITEQKCRVCHSGSIEDLSEAESIDEVSFHADENLNTLCWGCHKWKPHPGGGFSFFKSQSGPNHLVKPSEKVLERIKKTLKDRNILMPLEPGSGKVFCATCHNPHAIGVINNEAAATGAETKSRLRSEKICSNCHIM